MNKLTLTLRVDSEYTRPQYPLQPFRTEKITEVETLCDIKEQHLSKGMLAAALRQLADEVDPVRTGEPF